MSQWVLHSATVGVVTKKITGEGARGVVRDALVWDRQVSMSNQARERLLQTNVPKMQIRRTPRVFVESPIQAAGYCSR
jgi:hypothetical protein